MHLSVWKKSSYVFSHLEELLNIDDVITKVVYVQPILS